MSLIDRVRAVMGITPITYEQRQGDDWGYVNLANGMVAAMALNQTMPGQKQEDIDGSFDSFVNRAYKSNPIIFAVINTRMRVFTEARFQFRRMTAGRPGDLFGSPALSILETPWVNGTTGDLLARMLQDADLSGNFYGRLTRTGIERMDPSKVSIILDRPSESLGAKVIGYEYYPRGRYGGEDPVRMLASEVCHFAPIPDPAARYRGMSWLTPLIREIQADSASTVFKQSFLENGATPNLVIKRPQTMSKADFDSWVKLMEAGHSGAANAYKTLYLTEGADATVIGANLRQVDFSQTQGAGETRIAAAAGVPPIIVGLSEGLAAATYSNYGQARRAFADGTLRPLWRNAAGSLASIVNVPAGSQLWYDDRDIPFLREDKRDAAEIQQVKASTISSLVSQGFTRESIVAAVAGEDETLLVVDPEWVSVQVQEVAKTSTDQLIAQVAAGLITHDEARATLGKGPIVWSEDLTPEEIKSIIEQIDAGLLTHDEARKLMKRGPAVWSDELSEDEIKSLIAQVDAGLLTHDEARKVMKLGPMKWSDDLSKEENDMLLEQVKAGLVTHDEARAILKLPPMVWSDDLSEDEVAALVEQIKAGILTENEARLLLGRPEMEWPEDLNEKVQQASDLIKTGFDPADVMSKLGLPPIKHLGLPPITVQKLADAEPPEPPPEPPVGQPPMVPAMPMPMGENQ